LSDAHWGQVVVAFAAAAGFIGMIALGFLISSIAVLALRSIFPRIAKHPYPYEARLLVGAANKIRQRLGGETSEHRDSTKPTRADKDQEPYSKPDALYLSAAFDHGGLIPEGVHGWVFRRWSIFCVASNSAVGLVLAPMLGWFIGIFDWRWIAVSAACIGILIRIAVFAYRDAMGMLNFAADLNLGRSGKKGR
jgi:hypothetical protein